MPTEQDLSNAPRLRVRAELSWTSVVVAGVSAIALVAVWGALRSASSAVTIVVVGLFLAMALDPVVNSLARWTHLARSRATVIVLLLLVVLSGGFVAVAAPQLITESAQIEHQLPETIKSLDGLPLVGDRIAKLDLVDRFDDLIAALPERVDHSAEQVGGILRTATSDLGVVLIAFLIVAGALLEGPRMIDDIRRSIPAAHVQAADRVGRTVYDVLARYFAGSIFIALLNGIWVASVALAAGVPMSPVLGVWTALTCLIPQLGGLLGFVIVFAVSLTAGLVPTLIMTVAFLAFLLLNNHLLNPMIVGHSVSLSAPVTMIAALAGFSVAGIVGALLAVPAFGAVKAVAQVFSGEGSADDGDAEASPLKRPREIWNRLVARIRRRPHDTADDSPSGDG